MSTSIGISWYTSFGSDRRIDNGSTCSSISWSANLMGSVIPDGIGINEGAPRASWRDLAPMILARSNLVSRGGPIVTENLVFFPLLTFGVFPSIFFLESILFLLEVANYHQTPDEQYLRKKSANKSY